MNTKNIIIGIVVIVIIGLVAYFVTKSSSDEAAPGTDAAATSAAEQVQGQEVKVGTGEEAKPGAVVTVDYVGHPFRETLPPLGDRRTFLLGHNLDPEALTIALLPGSRAGEIERHLPIMLEAASLIHRSIPQTQFILPLASTAPEELVQSICFGDVGAGLKPAPTALRLRIIPRQAYQTLGAAHVAVVASGTATVEAALAGTPTVIVYRVSPLTFALARRLVRVPHVGMANLLAGERVFPELLQDDFTPERLAHEVLSLIQDPGRIKAVRRGLATVIRRLGGPGASARAARVAVELITSARSG